MRKIPIDWDDLESAFERNAPDTESFLDTTTGRVVTIVAGDPEAPSLKTKVAAEIANHTRIDPASSREQYRWMERFVGSVTDEALRERLLISIDGKGAFRRFKDVLLAYPTERERWFTYRADLLHWHMHTWLEERGIEPITPPPWGEVKPPPELSEAPPRLVAVGTEPPGEMLRRQARELIDGLAAIELPSAIAFLDFLRERGARTLNKPRTADAPGTSFASEGSVEDDPDDSSETARAEPRPGEGAPGDEPSDDDDDRPAPGRAQATRPQRAELSAQGK